jgi:hypothetical protein
MTCVDDDAAHLIKLENGQPLAAWKRISDFWKEQLPEDVLSVVLPRPAGSECEWLIVSTVAI